MQVFRSPLLAFTFFSQFDSTKLNSIRKILEGKVQNFSTTKISSFTVNEYKKLPSKFWFFSDLSKQLMISGNVHLLKTSDSKDMRKYNKNIPCTVRFSIKLINKPVHVKAWTSGSRHMHAPIPQWCKRSWCVHAFGRSSPIWWRHISANFQQGQWSASGLC